MMETKSRRDILRVRYNRKTRLWDVHRARRMPGFGAGDGLSTGFVLKRDAYRMGQRLCRAAWQAGWLTQLIVHKKDGTIQTEHTYGRDPKRTKG